MSTQTTMTGVFPGGGLARIARPLLQAVTAEFAH
jgi:hypothetical protein